MKNTRNYCRQFMMIVEHEKKDWKKWMRKRMIFVHDNSRTLKFPSAATEDFDEFFAITQQKLAAFLLLMLNCCELKKKYGKYFDRKEITLRTRKFLFVADDLVNFTSEQTGISVSNLSTSALTLIFFYFVRLSLLCCCVIFEFEFSLERPGRQQQKNIYYLKGETMERIRNTNWNSSKAKETTGAEREAIKNKKRKKEKSKVKEI